MSIEQEILLATLAESTEKSLWCADENAHNLGAIQFKGKAITNRIDIYHALTAQGIDTRFNNFDFSEYHSVDQIIFRIAKEKAINFHIIDNAKKRLNNEGTLWLIGGKKQGIKSLGKTCQTQLQATVTSKKYKQQYQRLCISNLDKNTPALLDSAYEKIHFITFPSFTFYSQLGVFGWNKIDRGSEILIDALQTLKVDTRASLLDLGCGYGYLSLQAKKLGFNTIDATDNNAAAISAAQYNFKQAGISGEVIADDCAKNNAKKYGVILCNPPFHKGFDHHQDISSQFIHALHQHLKPQGSAYIVCNQFVAVEKLASSLFSHVIERERKEGFKVLQLIQ